MPRARSTAGEAPEAMALSMVIRSGGVTNGCPAARARVLAAASWAVPVALAVASARASRVMSCGVPPPWYSSSAMFSRYAYEARAVSWVPRTLAGTGRSTRMWVPMDRVSDSAAWVSEIAYSVRPYEVRLSVPKPSSLANSISGCWMPTYASSVRTPGSAAVYASLRRTASCGSALRKVASRRFRLAESGIRAAAASNCRAAVSVAARAAVTSGLAVSPASSGTAVRSRSLMSALP